MPKRTILPAFRLALWYSPISHVLSSWPCFFVLCDAFTCFLGSLVLFLTCLLFYGLVSRSLRRFFLFPGNDRKSRRSKCPDGSHSFCSFFDLVFHALCASPPCARRFPYFVRGAPRALPGSLASRFVCGTFALCALCEARIALCIARNVMKRHVKRQKGNRKVQRSKRLRDNPARRRRWWSRRRPPKAAGVCRRGVSSTRRDSP